jgi:hypothetical protein
MQGDRGDNEGRHRCRMPYPVSIRSQARGDVDLLGHGSDLLGLADTSSMCDIRLDDINTASFEVRSAIKTCEQSLSELISQLVSVKQSLYSQQ